MMEFISPLTQFISRTLNHSHPGTLEAAFGVPKANMFMMDDYGPSIEKMYTQKVRSSRVRLCVRNLQMPVSMSETLLP